MRGIRTAILLAGLLASGCMTTAHRHGSNPIEKGVKSAAKAGVVAVVAIGAAAYGISKYIERKGDERLERKSKTDRDAGLERQWRRAKRDRAHRFDD